MPRPEEQSECEIAFLVHFAREVALRIEEGRGWALCEALDAAECCILDYNWVRGQGDAVSRLSYMGGPGNEGNSTGKGNDNDEENKNRGRTAARKAGKRSGLKSYLLSQNGATANQHSPTSIPMGYHVTINCLRVGRRSSWGCGHSRT
jgi:hypothetical protein